MFYSKETGGFYDVAIHGDNIPADAVQISAEQHTELMAAQSQGAAIQADQNGEPIAVYPAPPSLAEVQAAAIKRIDTDVDAIYAAVIGNRQAEYDLAESDANAYKAAGYTGTVPNSVQSWASAKKKTAKWSADDILATATNWRGAQADIRASRLARKEDVRNATDPASVATVLATWSAYVAQVRSALDI